MKLPLLHTPTTDEGIVVLQAFITNIAEQGIVELTEADRARVASFAREAGHLEAGFWAISKSISQVDADELWRVFRSGWYGAPRPTFSPAIDEHTPSILRLLAGLPADEALRRLEAHVRIECTDRSYVRDIPSENLARLADAH